MISTRILVQHLMLDDGYRYDTQDDHDKAFDLAVKAVNTVAELFQSKIEYLTKTNSKLTVEIDDLYERLAEEV